MSLISVKVRTRSPNDWETSFHQSNLSGPNSRSLQLINSQLLIALIHNTIDKLYEFNCIIKLKELLYNLNVARFNSTKNVYYSWWSLMPNCLNFIDQYYKNKAVLFPFVLQYVLYTAFSLHIRFSFIVMFTSTLILATDNHSRTSLTLHCTHQNGHCG